MRRQARRYAGNGLCVGSCDWIVLTPQTDKKCYDYHGKEVKCENKDDKDDDYWKKSKSPVFDMKCTLLTSIQRKRKKSERRVSLSVF